MRLTLEGKKKKKISTNNENWHGENKVKICSLALSCVSLLC